MLGKFLTEEKVFPVWDPAMIKIGMFNLSMDNVWM